MQDQHGTLNANVEPAAHSPDHGMNVAGRIYQKSQSARNTLIRGNR